MVSCIGLLCSPTASAPKVSQKLPDMSPECRDFIPTWKVEAALTVEPEVLSQQVSKLREESAELQRTKNALAKSNTDLVEDNRQLIIELARMKAAGHWQHQISPAPTLAKQAPIEHHAKTAEAPRTPGNSYPEGSLRAALSNHGTTTEELRSAADAVASLLEEARREIAAREFRERRAAYEQLHNSMGTDNESVLADAIAEAQRTNVHVEDIVKAEEQLQQLRSLTDAEREAKETQKRHVEIKRRAFLFVKKDDALSLQLLLESEGSEVQVGWESLRDHASRTLWMFAQDAKAHNVQRYLAPKLGHRLADNIDQKVEIEPETNVKRSGFQPLASLGEKLGAPHLVMMVLTPRTATAPAEPSLLSPQQLSTNDEEVVTSPSEKSPLRAKAFRAVASDDVAALEEILIELPTEVWTQWQNRAGKDLVTLSQERGSYAAYSLLAKALGILQEMKHEAFEEREAVWVLMPGELQPRHATVIEDTSESAKDVLVEFWDSYDPPTRVEHCLVSKANN